MRRILLLLASNEDRRLLADYLGPGYNILLPEQAEHEQALNMPFDLCILDGFTLDRLWGTVKGKKEAEEPIFLPFLLVTSRRDIGLITRHLYETIDDLIIRPIEKVELTARLEVLLRTHRNSLELKLRNDDLEAFINAMTHDLRAPIRIIDSFTEVLFEDQAAKLDEEGRHYLRRIQKAAGQARELIDSLLDFARIGRKRISLAPTQLRSAVDAVLLDLEEDIQSKGAEIEVAGKPILVQANYALLKVVFANLLSNAMKFVAPGVRPRVNISTSFEQGICYVRVRDNGIGITPEDQERIFKPFVRLHGAEEYPGTGLGLSTVLKAVELMGGKVGVESSPGKGSMFWVKLSCGEEA